MQVGSIDAPWDSAVRFMDILSIGFLYGDSDRFGEIPDSGPP